MKVFDLATASPAKIGFVVIISWLAFRLIQAFRTAYLSPLRHVPGPSYARWTNLWLKLQVVSGNRCQYIHEMHQIYGPYVRISPDEIDIADLASIKQVYRVGSNFLKSPWYQKFNESPHPGIFSMTDAKQHATRRRLFAQSFSKSALTKFEVDVRKKVETAIAKIDRDLRVGTTDILQWFTFMATDVIGQLSFGESFNMLEQEMKTPYIADLETVMMIGGIRAELRPLIRLAQLIPLPSLQRALSLPDRLDQYGLAALENHREHITNSANKESASLFSKFLDPTKNQELKLPQISAEASNLIVAGSDTTAVSLTYLIWMLLRPQHAAIKQKLLAEIAPVPLDTSVADLSQLDYLNAIITEALRLYGAAPGSLPRITPDGGAKLGEYFVPAGTTVCAQAYTVHRDPVVFTDAERFVPERWHKPTEAMKDANFPFGLGARVCIGLHLATSELLLGTFLFFKTCPDATLAPSTTDESMAIENYFLIAPRGHRCEIAREK